MGITHVKLPAMEHWNSRCSDRSQEASRPIGKLFTKDFSSSVKSFSTPGGTDGGFSLGGITLLHSCAQPVVAAEKF